MVGSNESLKDAIFLWQKKFSLYEIQFRAKSSILHDEYGYFQKGTTKTCKMVQIFQDLCVCVLCQRIWYNLLSFPDGIC